MTDEPKKPKSTYTKRFSVDEADVILLDEHGFRLRVEAQTEEVIRELANAIDCLRFVRVCVTQGTRAMSIAEAAHWLRQVDSFLDTMPTKKDTIQ